MKSQKLYQLYFIPATFVVGMFFLGCENDLEEVRTVTATDETPDQVINDVHMLHSDSGYVEFELTASRMEQFFLKKKLTLFKDGFEVNFYKRDGRREAHLQADYGELKEDEGLIVARNQVIFTNFTQQKTLKTEELYWDQKRRRCHTDKAFEIIGPTIYGKGYGLDCDETFSDYLIHDGGVKYIDTTKQ